VKHREVEAAATTEGIPLGLSMAPTLEQAQMPVESSLIDARIVLITAVSVVLAVVVALVAQVLIRLIWLITNAAFHGRCSFASATPPTEQVSLCMIGVPIAGAVIVGLLARFGSKAIRGHGIPEAMEQILLNQSRIPRRITLLKPLSAAIAIGTGGPFGAEGPIIATGGALGSLVGQLMHITTIERKTLLAAGAAAGMSATFGAPVSAVLLAIELLLFEYRPRSIIPVAMATSTAAVVRMAFDGTAPVFAMPDLLPPTGGALAAYVVLGALMGIFAVLVTRTVYLVEDLFEHLPLHWMWWPAVGAIAVGVVGYFVPRTLGVGYYNIEQFVSFGDAKNPANLTVAFVAILCVAKFISWAIALGSGTSGGTLAPLFTIGGGVGVVFGALARELIPRAHIDLRVAALVGMAAMFAGASRALLASVVFAFETTLQPLGLLPLLGGCAASFLVSALLMRNTIMTEKLVRRGTRVPSDYAADFLDQLLVRDACAKAIIALRWDQSLGEVRRWISSRAAGSSHQGFPVVGPVGTLVGVVTRRTLLDTDLYSDDQRISGLVTRQPVVIFDDSTLRAAADHMVMHEVGRLPVVARGGNLKPIGFYHTK
jgi:chloride channel protein, CIC family